MSVALVARASLFAAGVCIMLTGPAFAQDKLTISIWGGSWRDLVAATAAKKFKEQTGADVEFVTGGTIDRLNKAILSRDHPESDITFTTSKVGLRSVKERLHEELGLANVPN